MSSRSVSSGCRFVLVVHQTSSAVHFTRCDTAKLGIGVDYGLNWKSLTQPAILPLTTYFAPTIKMMDTKYQVNGSYQLLVQKNESPFATPEDLMKELICLRLTQV
jgi:hypothetical protein